ncbi:MAG: hypothetical protein K9G49_13545 [Taibaiella sp.]|nr:hypothetical protein [Taibaiella sp.]
MEFTSELLHNQEKKEAHLRRASIFIGWLHKPEYGYANYVDDNSIHNLAKLIKRLVIWALEVSMPKKDWQMFHGRLLEISEALYQPSAETMTEKQIYLHCVEQLRATLLDYIEHISKIYVQQPVN